jgi:hypothetical protein
MAGLKKITVLLLFKLMVLQLILVVKFMFVSLST